MEAYAAEGPAPLEQDDVESDHVEEMARLLSAQEEAGREDELGLVPHAKKMRFDLCPCCYRKFLADPLGREVVNFDFSEN